MVLLKNEGHILPLSASTKTIAVIGPNAANLASIEGNYNGIPSQPVAPLKGIETYFAGRSKVLYAQGSVFTSELSAVVPRTVFGAGLKGEYFSTADLSGTPAVNVLGVAAIEVTVALFATEIDTGADVAWS